MLDKLVASFRHSEKLQKHVAFLYAKGSVYHIENGCLLYHGAVPLTDEGEFAAETFEGHSLRGRALLAGLFVVLVVRQALPAVWPQRHDHL